MGRAYPVYSMASYASVQKSVNTLGGSGESIMRWVKRMPIIPSAGSMYAVVPIAAGPTESAWRVENLSTPNVYRHSKTPAGIVAEEEFRARALLGSELIGRHQLHRGA